MANMTTLQILQGIKDWAAPKVIYDISAAHNNTKYTDLSNALGTNGDNIPQEYRKGGITVRYVQSSDNKYVQYRLTANEWSINTEDWAIADESVYVENPEFVYVKTDSEGKILWAIRTDGGIYYGAGVPQQVIDYINDKIAELSLDEYEDMVAFLNDLEKGDKTLQDLLDEKVDKVEGQSLIDAEYANGVRYIENPEFAEVKVDNGDKILEGIQKDGTKVIGGDLRVLGTMEVSGVSYKVIENPEFLAAWVGAEDKVIFGLKTDGKTYVGDADFLNNIKNNQEAISEINATIASISSTIESLDIDALTSITATENPEFIKVELDAEDKILSGRKTDGTKFENNDVEINGNATVGGSLKVDGVIIKNSEDPEGRKEITLDSEERIISYRKEDGTLAENAGFETPIAKIEQLEVGNIKMSEKDKAKFIGNDSNPYLRIDRIDIISSLLIVSGNAIHPLNTTKNEVGDVNTDDVVFKYTSKDGGFTDNCSIAYQGNSSLRWTKKGFAVDLANKHRFKDWIEHDSFNIKGYATDWMHVREYIGTTIYEQMMQHRPIGHRRPWELYNDFKDSDYQNGCPSSALGHSDQHPVELYINGNYWGLYSISLKKKKENYEMKKNNAKHIMLDATGGFSCAKNWFSWPGAEIRFPKEDKNKKKLLDKDLNNYDGDNPKELLGEDNPLYDPDNSTHVFCNTVKQKILAFYQFNHNIDNTTTKEQIEAHWNIEEFIDSYLQTNFIGNSDVGGKNTLYCTWDGVHWAPLAYDFDLTFGCGWTNGINQVDVHLAFERYPASNREGAFDCIPGAAQIKTLYQTEIEARYKELRDTGIFTAENVSKIIKDWMIEVGEDVYKDDLDRWSGVYGNRGTKNMYGEEDVECYVNQQALYDYVVTRLTELDTLFNYISN